MGASLAGIIYVHSIRSNRVHGSDARSFRMLEQLCGMEAFGRVAIVTSMWDQIQTGDYKDAVRREEELLNTEAFLGAIYRRSGHATRFLGTEESARLPVDALAKLYDRDGIVTFQVQREVIGEGKDLLDTSAAREIANDLVRTREHFEEQLRDVSAHQEKAKRQKDKKGTKELSKDQQFLEKNIQLTNRMSIGLQVSLADIYAKKQADFARMLGEVRKEKATLQKELEKYEGQRQRLVEEEASDRQTLEKKQAKLLAHHEAQISEARKKGQWEEKARRKRDIEIEAVQSQHRKKQEKTEKAKETLEGEMKMKEHKIFTKQNFLPLLGILAGVGTVAIGLGQVAVGVVAQDGSTIGGGVGLCWKGGLGIARNLPLGHKSHETVENVSLVTDTTEAVGGLGNQLGGLAVF